MASVADPEDCASCRFSRVGFADDVADGVLLHCFRFPPQIFVAADGVVSQTWLTMDADHWCGEWAPSA
jgi:hypothetical protein